jgi:hypothetical protein
MEGMVGKVGHQGGGQRSGCGVNAWGKGNRKRPIFQIGISSIPGRRAPMSEQNTNTLSLRWGLSAGVLGG